MESQTNCFTNSPYIIPPTSFYTSYNTPPHSLIWSSWPEAIHQPFSMNEDVLQMQQQLRFPTPPITPPRGYSNITGEYAYAQALQVSPTSQTKTQQQRTQSVIMKIGHDQNPQHLPADDPSHIKAELLQRDFHHHDQQHVQSYNDTPSSGNSSPTSHSEFVCDWIDCGRYFESLELLAHHVTLIHAVASLSDGLYYCKWMGCQRTERGFNARYKMLVHVRTHTKEKPHQCHLCDKRFSRAENLKIHIRSHSGEKPYICNFQGCNKAYSNSSDRFKHTRTHSMEKPYMCKVPGCEKRYTDPSSLRKHVKTFKHSLHILSTKTSTEVPQKQNFKDSKNYASCPPIGETQKNCSHITLQNRSSNATQDSFCMDMEELCHIEATFNYYPATASTPAETEPSYWLKESETKNTLHRIHTLTYQQATNYNMQTDLTVDKPLDLRIKRS